MSICRTCLCSDSKIVSMSSDVATFLGSFIGKEINLDSASGDICLRCVSLLKQMDTFKKMCLETDAMWRTYLSKYTNRSHSFVRKYFQRRRGRLKSTLPQSNLQITPSICLSNDETDGKLAPVGIITFVRGKMMFFEDVKKELDADGSSIVSKHIMESQLKSEDVETADICNWDPENEDDNKFADSEQNFDDMTLYNEKKEPVKREFIKINDDEGFEIKLTVEEQKEELQARMLKPEFVNAEFKCYKCARWFSLRESLLSHMEKHSQSRGDEVCEVCSIRFDTARQLRTHSRLHSMRVQCVLCAGRYRSRGEFQQHVDQHKGVTYQCGNCDETFSIKKSLESHMASQHSEVDYPCEFCPATFKLKKSLNRHRISHLKNPMYPCKFCDNKCSTKYHLNRHTRKQHDKEVRAGHYCVECDATFSSRSALKTHFNTVARHKDPSTLIYPCDRCSKLFPTEASLSHHTASYHERTPRYSCSECGCVYASHTGLRHHTNRVHRGLKVEANYKCDTCNKAFTSKYILVNHIRTHTGEQPYQCTICSRSFSQSSTLANHLRLVHHLPGRRRRKEDGTSV